MAERHAAGHSGDPVVEQLFQQRLGLVRRDQQHSIDVPCADEVRGAVPLGRGACDEQYERHRTLSQRGGRPAQQECERRVVEQQVLRLGEQKGQRPGPAGRQTPCVVIGRVSGRQDRSFDSLPRIGGDPVPAVDHARDRAARDACLCRDLADRRLAPRR
jgi:hypothetical protein